MEAGEERKSKSKKPVFKISLAGNPSSCVFKIGKLRYRTLIDSGAECSLISKKMYQNLSIKPTLSKNIPQLQAANGGSLSVIGQINLTFTMNGLSMNQKFYVTDGLNRNFILGRDWLKQFGVRIYFDLGMLRINKTYVKLEEDCHIASIVRLKKKTTIKPQSAVICHVKLNQGFQLSDGKIVELSNFVNGCINDEPGLHIRESVNTSKTPNRIPIMIINETNRCYRLRKGSVIGKARPLSQNEVNNIEPMEVDQGHESDDDFQEIQVSEGHRPQIIRLVRENKDLFAKSDKNLGSTTTVKMRIQTDSNQQPIRNRPYRTPLNKRKIIDQAIDEMLEAKVIERSQSPWSFPLVVVKKKDGSDRMCVDFRTLNKIVRPVSYPLPLIDDILSLLGNARYFTALDLKSGYWQVQLDEDSKEKTAFACHRGLFQFNVMPFGLSNAPAVFQELMNIVLQGCEDFAMAYLDDVLIFSKDPKDHLHHIQTIFDRLRQHGLKLKLKKCAFFQEETGYLGFVINKDGVKPDPGKVKAIRSLPEPRNVREVRGFIGMCSYYRRFIPNFSKIAEPLINLTKKYARFKWNSDCQAAFDYLKESLSVVPLLAYPDTNKPYVLYTDASNNCIGACLTQQTDENEEKPIYYLSHKLSPTQTKWSTIEKEGYAIYYALQKLDHYLHNAKFTIKTDHQPLKYILDSPMQNKKIQLWALCMAGYNCTVQYVKGSDNPSDLLSRVPTRKCKNSSDVQDAESDVEELDIDDRALEVGAINSNKFSPRKFASSHVEPPGDPKKPEVDLPEEINMKEEQDKDEGIQTLKSRIKKGTATKAEQTHYFETTDGLLYYLSQPDSEDPMLRLYIPQEMERIVIKQYHDQLGHMGLDKTYDSIRLKYFFPNMYRKIYTYIEKCIPCQAMSDKKPKPPLHETEIPPYPFAKIGLDLSGPYPTTLSGNRYIVSFVDLYSGWPEAFPVPDKSADHIVHLILEEIFPRFGCPLQIVTDNGTENINRKVQETLDAMNIHHIKTSYYSPQSNARTERFHRSLHSILSKHIQEDVQTWDLYLNQTLAAIRFHVNESSKFSPFFLLYNRDVVLPLDTILKPRRRQYSDNLHEVALQQQHKSFVMVHRHMKEAKRRQKEYADRNSKDDNFQVGDPVYLRNHRRTNKLDVKWSPFFRVISKTGPLSFVVRSQLDGTTTKVHARHLRHANIDEWEIPRDEDGRLLRRTTYVVPPEQSDNDQEEQTTPLQKVIRHKQQEREDSDDEADIPLAEMRRRLLSRDSKPEMPQDSECDTSDTELYYEPKTESDPPSSATDNLELRPVENMDVDSVAKSTTGSLVLTQAPSHRGQIETPPDPKLMIKNLLSVFQASLAL